jgi:hypothetical protein
VHCRVRGGRGGGGAGWGRWGGGGADGERVRSGGRWHGCFAMSRSTAWWRTRAPSGRADAATKMGRRERNLGGGLREAGRTPGVEALPSSWSCLRRRPAASASADTERPQQQAPQFFYLCSASTFTFNQVIGCGIWGGEGGKAGVFGRRPTECMRRRGWRGTIYPRRVQFTFTLITHDGRTRGRGGGRRRNGGGAGGATLPARRVRWRRARKRLKRVERGAGGRTGHRTGCQGQRGAGGRTLMVTCGACACGERVGGRAGVGKGGGGGRTRRGHASPERGAGGRTRHCTSCQSHAERGAGGRTLRVCARGLCVRGARRREGGRGEGGRRGGRTRRGHGGA